MRRGAARQARRPRGRHDAHSKTLIPGTSAPILDIHVEGQPRRTASSSLGEPRLEQAGTDSSSPRLALHGDCLQIPISGIVPVHGGKERPGRRVPRLRLGTPAGPAVRMRIRLGSPASVPGMPLRRPTTRPSSSARVAWSSDEACPATAQAAARIDSAAAPKSSVNIPSEAASSPRAKAIWSRSFGSAGRRRHPISRAHESTEVGRSLPLCPARSLVMTTSRTSAIPAAATPLT